MLLVSSHHYRRKMDFDFSDFFAEVLANNVLLNIVNISS